MAEQEKTFEEMAKDLGYDLTKAQEETLETQEEQTEEKKPLTALERFLERYKDHPQCPSQATLDRWKRDCIGLYVFNAEVSGETYIFRPLNRMEWKQLKDTSSKLQDNTELFQELIVGRCVLWPANITTMLPASRAGLVQTLFSAIMASSYFMSEEAVLSFVEKL